ncbi:hypothetical protein [Actinomyces oris]|uniref:hypothetical protein n=1 Tax=Actinomyces oris TaxID=544580 RepID=UPI0031BB6FB2
MRFQADIATGVRHTDRVGLLISSTRWLITSVVRLTPTTGLPSPYGNLLLITSTLSIRLITSALHTIVILILQATVSITTFARQDDPPVLIHRRVHQHPLKEHLVQLLPQVIRCRHIQPVAVLQQIQRLLNMRPHQLGIRLVGIELTLNPRKLSPQPLLLLLEQLQRHCSTVVRLQQPAPLILQVRPPHRQRPDAPILLPLDPRQLR